MKNKMKAATKTAFYCAILFGAVMLTLFVDSAAAASLIWLMTTCILTIASIK